MGFSFSEQEAASTGSLLIVGFLARSLAGVVGATALKDRLGGWPPGATPLTFLGGSWGRSAK